MPHNFVFFFRTRLVFTNAVKHAQLERIAEADSHEVVKDFQVRLARKACFSLLIGNVLRLFPTLHFTVEYE